MPRDGEWIPSDGEDGLLAQVIPLRRSVAEPTPPQILADEPRGGLGPQKRLTEPDERSVWDVPAELPRRPPPGRARAHGLRTTGPRLATRLGTRQLVGATAALASAVAVAASLTVVGPSDLSPDGPPPGTVLQASAPASVTPRTQTRSAGHADLTAHGSVHSRTKTSSSTSTRSAVKHDAATGTDRQASPVESQKLPKVSTQVVAATSTPAASATAASANSEFGFER